MFDVQILSKNKTHWKKLVFYKKLGGQSDQRLLFDVIGTWERICHLIRSFVDYLLELTMFYVPITCALKDQLTLTSLQWKAESLPSDNSKSDKCKLLVLTLWLGQFCKALFLGLPNGNYSHEFSPIFNWEFLHNDKEALKLLEEIKCEHFHSM